MRRDKGPMRGVYLKGQRFYYKRRLSPKVAKVLGQANIVISLCTTDAVVAAAKAEVVRQAVDKQIAEAKARPRYGHGLKKISDPFKEAEEWRQILAQTPFESDIDIPVDDWLYKQERTHGREHAERLSDIAFGRKKLIRHLLEERLKADPVTKSTANAIRQAVELLIERTGQDCVEDIDRKTCLQFADDLLDDGQWSRSTVQKHIQKLKSVWNFAVKRGDLETSPWSVVTIRGVKETDRRAPTAKEFETLLRAAEGDLRHAIRIGLRTGVRIGELSKLRPEHVEGDMLLIPGTKSKAADRIVPIHPSIQGDVEAWVNAPKSTVYITKHFRNLRDSLGLSKWITYHGLRKLCYGQLVEVESRTYLISKIMGHSTTGLMEVYAGSISKEVLREVINKLPPLPGA